MNRINDIIKSFLIGVGFGSFFLMAVTFSYEQIIIVSRKEFVIVLVASGIIGLYSYLFQSEHLNFLVAFILHFLFTFLTIFLTYNLLYHVTDARKYLIVFLVFIIIYILIWGIHTWWTKYEINEVNKKIG